ncbi:MAG: hypothetical protein JWR63_2674 [Conexibacter sp.]|nr:hypothetical protein [Conexibacter sp.]
MRLGRAALAALVVCAGGVGASGCGSGSSSAAVTSAPTVSLWVSATAKDYRQVGAGVKLALAEAGGRAGAFRVNYAGRQVSDDPARATADAVANARTSLQDVQASAVLTNVATPQAEPAITLLNEAGIPTVALGDDALAAAACSARSDIYPSGRQTAIVVRDAAAATIPSSFRSSFSSALHFTPTAPAWRAYEGAKAILASLAAPAVATSDSPPRLNRDALAAELVRAHGDCA